jgi:hypothetical protein
MTASTQSTFTQQELNQLQRLRASVLTFQNSIASLPADQQSNPHNEQFNQLRLEARALLRDPAFDRKVADAVTHDTLAKRAQNVILPRLSGIVIFGVILALLGLGVNSIILDDLVINSLGCLVSSGGMLLVIGALGVWGMANYRQKLTNFGDLYQRCDRLLYQLDHTLNMAIPNWADRPGGDIAEIPSLMELRLDSLNKQATDWQHKLKALEEQRLTLGSQAPLELAINIDFVQRELAQARQEIDRLKGRGVVALESDNESDAEPAQIITPAVRERARAVTGEMRALNEAEEITESESEDEDRN